MSSAELEQRKQRILGLVVEAYVGTASPVGSELIWRKLRQSVSPATIRSAMAALDREGLLEQPHTSAGRRPTDRGYRVYVDAVMDVPRLAPEQVRQMEQHIEPDEMDAERLMEQASHVLAALTHQAAFVVAPTKTPTLPWARADNPSGEYPASSTHSQVVSKNILAWGSRISASRGDIWKNNGSNLSASLINPPHLL